MTNLKSRSQKQRIFRKVRANFLRYPKKTNSNFLTENRKDCLKWKCPQNCFQDYNLNREKKNKTGIKNLFSSLR